MRTFTGWIWVRMRSAREPSLATCEPQGRRWRDGLPMLLLAFAAAACASSGPSPIVVAPREAASPNPWTAISPLAPILGGDQFGGPGNQYTFDAVAYMTGFVLVGEDFRSDDDVRGRIWSSSDGKSWNTIDEPTDVFANSEVDHVAASGLRLVAIGTHRDGDPSATPRPLVWLSDDALSWHRSEAAGIAFGTMSVTGIAGGRDGFVAWGAAASGQAEILVSSDGENWTASGFSGDFPDANVDDVTGAGEVWVAVGSRRRDSLSTGGPPPVAEAWFSADGFRWSAAAVDGPAFARVFAGTAAFFATGASECGSCVSPGNLWHSETGTSWQLIGPEPVDNPSYAASGGRIVRVSILDSISLALSTDGLNWTILANDLGAHSEYGAIAVGQQGVVLLENPEANGGEADQVDAGVWYLQAQ